VRTLVLVLAALLAGDQILLAFAAKSLQETNTFAQLAALVPDFLRQVLGPSLLTLLSFRGIACLGYFHVAVLAVLMGLAIAVGTEPAGEAESRFVDLILAHPLARHWVITRSVVLLVACVIFLLGAMALGTRLGLYWLVPAELARATFQIIPELCLNLAVLLLCWGAIALVMASVARRRSVASACTALLAMACFMADVVAQVWQPLRPVARYSPFHYFRPLNLIMGSADAGSDILTLACAASVGFVLAHLFFERRDL
jgi:ABC-2 type transport system permease protein